MFASTVIGILKKFHAAIPRRTELVSVRPNEFRVPIEPPFDHPVKPLANEPFVTKLTGFGFGVGVGVGPGVAVASKSVTLRSEILSRNTV